MALVQISCEPNRSAAEQLEAHGVAVVGVRRRESRLSSRGRNSKGGAAPTRALGRVSAASGHVAGSSAATAAASAVAAAQAPPDVQRARQEQRQLERERLLKDVQLAARASSTSTPKEQQILSPSSRAVCNTESFKNS